MSALDKDQKWAIRLSFGEPLVSSKDLAKREITDCNITHWMLYAKAFCYLHAMFTSFLKEIYPLAC